MNLVAVLTNLKSTRNLSVVNRVRAVIDAHNGVFHYEIDDVADIPEVLRRFAEYGADILVINGGDGTIQATFSSLINDRPFERVPPVAILPAGKTNMIAEDLGARKPRPHLYLERILTLAARGGILEHTEERHLLKVEGIPGQAPLHGMFLGTAGIVEGITACRRKIYPLGLPNFLSHSLAVAVIAFGAVTGRFGRAGTAPAIKVRLDDKGAVVGHYFLIIVTTLNRLILGFKPFGREGHGPVHFLSVESRPWTVIRSLWLAITGRIHKTFLTGLTARNAKAVRIRARGAVTVDGEMYSMPEDHDLVVSSDDHLRFLRLDGL
ncbi:MAG: diacylglycerol kinase family protein [Sphingomonadales bacterium]